MVAGLDVAATARGALTAYQQLFEVNATDGVVLLEFRPSKEDAIVAAIEME